MKTSFTEEKLAALLAQYSAGIPDYAGFYGALHKEIALSIKEPEKVLEIFKIISAVYKKYEAQLSGPEFAALDIKEKGRLFIGLKLLIGWRTSSKENAELFNSIEAPQNPTT